MLDLLVRSRRIVTPGGPFDGSIGVQGGKVVALYGPDAAPQTAECIDAGDKPVIPGLVDTHAHFRDPGYTSKEDFETGTRSAAAGGVTTVLDMPNVDPPTNTVARFRAHIANARPKALIDFGHNAAGIERTEIKGIAEAGATAFKIFMMKDVGRDYPHVPGTAVNDHGELYRLFLEIAKTGKTVMVHPHDQSLYEEFVRDYWSRGERDVSAYAKAWRDGDGAVLDLAIVALIELQRITGVKLHILHCSTRRAFDRIRDARAQGQTVTCELNPFSLFVTNSWERVQRLGPYCLGMWVPDIDAAAAWTALVNGVADVVATDHSPHTREEKEIGWTDMFKAPGGSPMIQHYLSLLLSEVARGRLTLARLVEVCCTKPAQLVGLYPRKGVIAPGADADLVVLDLERRETITAARSHYKCGWTPLEGWEVTGVPELVIQRGRIIARDGDVLAKPGDGRWVHEN